MQATIDILGVTRYILLWVILESSHGTQRSMSHRAGDLMIEVCLKLVLLFDFLGPVVEMVRVTKRSRTGSRVRGIRLGLHCLQG
jgi:hypothetical protein